MQNTEMQIPKPVLKAKASDNAKLMFSVIFTECVNKPRISDDAYEIVEQVNSLMKDYISRITYLEIMTECSCDRKRSKKVKKELNKLLKSVDISECFITKGGK